MLVVDCSAVVVLGLLVVLVSPAVGAGAARGLIEEHHLMVLLKPF